MSTPMPDRIACHAMHVDYETQWADDAIAALARLRPETRKAVLTGRAGSVRKALRAYSISLADAMGIPAPADNSDQ